MNVASLIWFGDEKMKYYCSILAVLAVGCALLLQAGCQPKVDVQEASGQPDAPIWATDIRRTQPKQPKGGTVITFEKEVHDFGEVGRGAKAVCQFNFKNAGDSLLKISKVQACCGVKAVLKNRKKEYAPGESGTVVITVNTTRWRGNFKKTIHVYSNDKTRRNIPLTITAQIVVKVRHHPAKLQLLPNKENAGCPKITLTSVDDQPFAIKGFRTPAGFITASFDSSIEATKFVLEPKVDVEKLGKARRGSITLNLTHPKCGSITIPFEVLSRFKITPSSTISIRRAVPQKPVNRKVWIVNNYGEDFEIESTSSKNNIARVLSKEKVDNRYKLEVEIIPPAAEAGKRAFSDVLYVNIKDGEKLTIRCNGLYLTKKKKSGSSLTNKT